MALGLPKVGYFNSNSFSTLCSEVLCLTISHFFDAFTIFNQAEFDKLLSLGHRLSNREKFAL